MNVKDEIKAKVAQGNVRGAPKRPSVYWRPFEGRTEVKIADLSRQIAQYQSILDKQQT
jgi:hypothetical protein